MSIYSYVNDGKNRYDLGDVDGVNIDSDFPLSNAFDDAATKFTKATGIAIKVNFDFGAAASLNLIAIINHNFRKTGDNKITTAVLQYGSSPPVGTGDLPVTVPGGYIYLDTHTDYSREGLFQCFTTTSARYWQLRVTLFSANPEIGEIWLGNQTEVPTPDFALSFDQFGVYDRTQSVSGRVRERELYVSRKMNLTYGLLIIDDKDLLDDFMSNVKFDKKDPTPFIFIGDSEKYYNPNKNMYCRVSDRVLMGQHTNVKYTLEEPITLLGEAFSISGG